VIVARAEPPEASAHHPHQVTAGQESAADDSASRCRRALG
jgi:hypothetical protein